MRSRYSAYTLGNIAYIEKTMCGSAKQGFNADEAQQSAVQSKWLGLTILKQHQDNDTVGFVEFVARYRLDQKAHRLHECSEFHYIGDRWYYVDGKLLGKIN